MTIRYSQFLEGSRALVEMVGWYTHFCHKLTDLLVLQTAYSALEKSLELHLLYNPSMNLLYLKTGRSLQDESLGTHHLIVLF